jgi:glycosyltransferase involved in cell wall biosynthesis
MRVSVVVPLYNKARYVRRCLESVCRQTFRDFEIIVVNDGSTDGSEGVVASVNDPRLILRHQANAGPGAARNRGLREARGEYVAFLDADDEWLPEYLERSVRALHETPEAASVTSCSTEPPWDDRVERLWRKRGITEGTHRVTASLAPALLVQMVAYMLPCSTVARASVTRVYGGFYERDRCLYAEDAFLWLQVILNRPVVFRLEPLVRIHRDAAELSGNLARPHPVEPFLRRPDLVRSTCPSGLESLLEAFLAVRAFKTACVLGYWGQWRQARNLRREFAIPGSWRLPYALPALACSTPLGSWLGAAWRSVTTAARRDRR